MISTGYTAKPTASKKYI